MTRSTSLNNGFAIIMGVFLILQGLWGLNEDVVFGILTTNKTHATIHIALGILGVLFGIKQNARSFTTFLGLLLVLVGALRFTPGADQVIISILNVNENAAFLNVLFGAVALVIASQKGKPIVGENEGAAINRKLTVSQLPKTERQHKAPEPKHKVERAITEKAVKPIQKHKTATRNTTEPPAKIPSKTSKPNRVAAETNTTKTKPTESAKKEINANNTKKPETAKSGINRNKKSKPVTRKP